MIEVISIMVTVFFAFLLWDITFQLRKVVKLLESMNDKQ